MLQYADKTYNSHEREAVTTTLRIDDSLKRECDVVFADLGMNLTTAMNVFLRQVVRTRTIPFVIGDAPPLSARVADGMRVWREIERFRSEYFSNGGREWTMDEINDEIASARSETPQGAVSCAR